MRKILILILMLLSVDLSFSQTNTVTSLTCGGTDKISAIGSDGTITCSSDQDSGGGLTPRYDQILDPGTHSGLDFASFTNTYTTAIGNSDFFKIDGSADFIVQGDGDTSVGGALTVTGTISGSNISGTNTGDQSEASIEAVVDLQDLQGAVTDGQVPDNITIDTANAVEGTDLGTLTDTLFCTYDLAGTEIDCNTSGGGGGDSITVNGASASDANFINSGKGVAFTIDTSPTPDTITSSVRVDQLVNAGTNSGNDFGSFTNIWTSSAGDNPFFTINTSTTDSVIRGDGNIGIGASDPSAFLVIGAGTTSAAPLKLTSGTNLTTAEDGAIELDADSFYGTTDAGNRGYIPIKNCIRADATRTFTSNTSQQAIFTTPANGRLTLETGVYLFDALIAMDTMSATSGNGKFSLNNGGSATLGAILWYAVGNDIANEATGAGAGGSGHTIATQTGTNVVTAATATQLFLRVYGTFEVTSGGTIVPSFAQTTAAAAIVKIGSYFCTERIGSTSMTNVGQWD
jgi:hypothetical protein